MEELIQISRSQIERVGTDFKRYLYHNIDWSQQLIGIKGSRGTGKTTLLLQWLRQHPLGHGEKIYLSLDDLYFMNHSLIEAATGLYNKGLKLLVLDEVHKYKNWHIEIKNLYDRYPDLQLIFTGSSIIDLSQNVGDLSRRALMYELAGLSYREYLHMTYGFEFPSLSLDDVLSRDKQFMDIFPKTFRPYQYWNDYLSIGYYPFSAVDQINFHQRLRQIVRMVVEFDMAELKGFDIRHAKKMLQLLVVLAQQVPFKPNIVKLAEKTNLHRNSILNYLYYLQEARLIDQLYPQGNSIATLQKSEKIYLDNTNLMFALSEDQPKMGTVRETFVNNQLRVRHRLTIPSRGDFAVDNAYVFEVGGYSKTQQQIQDLPHAFIVKDGLDFPIGNVVPIWMLGFLY